MAGEPPPRPPLVARWSSSTARLACPSPLPTNSIRSPAHSEGPYVSSGAPPLSPMPYVHLRPTLVLSIELVATFIGQRFGPTARLWSWLRSTMEATGSTEVCTRMAYLYASTGLPHYRATPAFRVGSAGRRNHSLTSRPCRLHGGYGIAVDTSSQG
ncbi:hypothetical protein L227DRAFT_263324 [Lentinus tigrinus ALCF2SS1-6]|uniref:Uncharacterized protein n=1 Tax=Lentinus tigrinus ALCF2SS1-6 TaxID=1328759 RepID=A0A5C2SNB3_9APHY|nr:hypothetical protein L227DRAFT_263324 [Lentinus tigrinus ALCF2SS1-6]